MKHKRITEILCVLLNTYFIASAENFDNKNFPDVILEDKTEIKINNSPAISENKIIPLHGVDVKFSFSEEHMTISVNDKNYLSVKNGVVFRIVIIESSIYFTVFTTIKSKDFSGMYFENFYSITHQANKVNFKKHLECVKPRELWKCNSDYYLACVDDIVGLDKTKNLILCKASIVQKNVIKPGEMYEYWNIAIRR